MPSGVIPGGTYANCLLAGCGKRFEKHARVHKYCCAEHKMEAFKRREAVKLIARMMEVGGAGGMGAGMGGLADKASGAGVQPTQPQA